MGGYKESAHLAQKGLGALINTHLHITIAKMFFQSK